MKEQQFEEVIEAEKCRCLPPCPCNLEESVLRKIRQESGGRAGAGGLSGLWSLPKGGLVLGSLAAAILLSTLTSLTVVSLQDRARASGELARTALDFQIFTEVQVVNLDHGD